MSYEKIWRKVLNEGEEPRYEFSMGNKYRWFGVTAWVIISAILFLPVIFSVSVGLGLWCFILINALTLFYFRFYARIANAYAFTNRRIIIHRGWLSTQTISVDYDKITDTTVIEPFFERIISATGGLAINTAGTSGQEIILLHIDKPYEVKKMLDQLRKK